MPIAAVSGVVHSWQNLAAETDATLQQLFAAAIAKHQPRGRVALLAVGGYGRSELAPFSDLDVLLIHELKTLDGAFAQSLWYPLWDAGRKVGHAVRTPKETFAMIRSDLDTATALVTARVVAGDAEFGQRVIDQCKAESG